MLTGPLIVDYIKEFLAEDSCLDSGGSFDYSRMVCDTEANHPFVPYAHRHPAAVGVGVVGVVSVAGAVGLLVRARQRSTS